MNDAFDREWQLTELLGPDQLARIGEALSALCGSTIAIADAGGSICWGVAPESPHRVAVIIELEPIGWLLGTSAEAATLNAAAGLMQLLLHAQARFHMAADLHVRAMTEDFETLRLEHARLLESEGRYKALAEQLEARVKKQVAQLEERQQMLYEAEKLASVGQLAAGIAHEINNPLGFVRSNLTTFQRYLQQFGELKSRLNEGEAAWKALDLDFTIEDGSDLLCDSVKGLDRIARIVAELKSFSNVDHASEEYSDINECLHHASSIIEGQLPAGVNIHLDLLPLPPIVCLPGHLNQMFLGLLRNAAQAIVDAGRSGTIRISSEADDDGIHIRIHDDGIGMSREQLARAFEPFYTTRPVGAGAGLGLSSARNIILAHSGRISLNSTEDAGTTVTIFLPVPK